MNPNVDLLLYSCYLICVYWFSDGLLYGILFGNDYDFSIISPLSISSSLNILSLICYTYSILDCSIFEWLSLVLFRLFLLSILLIVISLFYTIDYLDA